MEIKRAKYRIGGEKHLQIMADRAPGTRIVTGGYGSLKTSFGAAWTIDIGLQWAHLKAPVLGCEPTYPMVRDVMEPAIKQICERIGLPYKHYISDHIFRIGRKRKFEFWCRGLDRDRATEGCNAMAVWVDEWELLKKPQEQLIPALARCRVIDQRILAETGKEMPMAKLLTGTAEGYGPCYQMMLKNPDPSTRNYILTSYDNPFLPVSYIDQVKSLYSTQEEVDEKIYGIRGVKSGRVYSRFNRKIHCAFNAVEKVKNTRFAIACDFNVRYMHWLIIEIDDDQKRAHVIKEVIKEGGTTTDQHAERMAEELIKIYRKRGKDYSREDIFRKHLKAYVDSSGQNASTNSSLTDVHLLLKAGFQPVHGTQNPRVKDRINTVNFLFRDNRISIDPIGAPTLVNNLETLAYDKNGEPDKKNNIDHGIDALGYMCHWSWPVYAPEPNKPETRPQIETDEFGML